MSDQPTEIKDAESEVEDVPANLAQRGLPELLGRVQYGAERIRITKNGKPAAALVTPADLDRLLELDGAA